METKKHRHADLIIEYARQKAYDELQYYNWYRNFDGDWRQCVPSFITQFDYKFEMNSKHPQHPDNQVKLEVGDTVQSKYFTGIVCKLGDEDFRIIGTGNTGYEGAPRILDCVGRSWDRSQPSLEKLSLNAANFGYKILKKHKNDL